MDLQSHLSISQPATLHTQGAGVLDCVISSLDRTHATVDLDSHTSPAAIRTGDRLQLRVEAAGASLLIDCRVVNRHTRALRLEFTNPRDSGVRQLVNWHGAAQQRTAGLVTENQLLGELRDLASRQLAGLLDIFLEQVDARLLHLAEKAGNNDQQNMLFEAKSAMRQQRPAIRQVFLEQLQQRFSYIPAANAGTDNKPAAEHFEDMALVDRQAFEDWLSLDVIIRRAQEAYFLPLASLNKRFAQLLQQPLDDKQLPVSPDALCGAIREALLPCNLAHATLPVVYHGFEDAVVRQLGDLYDAMNSLLKFQGIVPNAETDVLRERWQSKSTVATAAPATAETVALATPGVAAAGAAGASPALFSTVKDLINLLHYPSSSPAAVPDGAPASAPLDTEQLLGELVALQADQQALQALAAGESLDELLQQSMGAPLAGEAADMLFLTCAIFDTLNSYPQLDAHIIGLIKQLQIPITRIALTDTAFFTQPDHPARRFINKLIELCLRSDVSNHSLKSRLDSLVHTIMDNFQEDRAIFDSALDQLSNLSTQQDSARNRNVERIVQTCEGRQRVQQAEDAVNRAVRRRLSAPEVPAIIIELLESGWRELLKLTCIKLGPDSETWNNHLETLDQLLLWVTAAGDTDSDSRYEGEQAADAMAELIAQELHSVLPGDYRYQPVVEKLRRILKGQQAPDFVSLDENHTLKVNPPNELQRELEDANPQLTRWFRRAKSLRVGDELSYLNDETGQSRIKLAWISENHQHFVFVNNRGQKVFDYDLVDLASEMARGLAPVEDDGEWPLVERSLYSTVQNAYEKLAYNSTHDELTGLINRKECERVLTDILRDAKNRRDQHCLLYIDIDKFGLANSLHGHVAGDQLLVKISQLLQYNSPDDAVVGRMAGNEFIVLLPYFDMQKGWNHAESLRRSLENSNFQWQEHNFLFTASIGLVAINKFTENVVDLLRHAVSACQSAKQGGGNRLFDFHQDAEQHTRREKLLSWIDRLSSILSSDRLGLQVQPIAPLHGGASELNHFEILLGIRNDAGELESPVEFIEAAECYNRMQRVDRWVIEKTFIWLRDLADQGTALPTISINLSGNSLNDDHFMDFLLEQFARFKIPTANICFEVTETATISNLAAAADFIREIKKIGCKFSLDDFGSGNASYQYLKHLPVDYLKIDGAFVREIVNNPNDFALVKSINDIAHLMGKKTIAEFVESEQIVSSLQDIGVDFLQGYAIGRPTPLSAVTLH